MILVAPVIPTSRIWRNAGKVLKIRSKSLLTGIMTRSHFDFKKFFLQQYADSADSVDNQLKTLHIPKTICVDIKPLFWGFALTGVNDVNGTSTQREIDIHSIFNEMSTLSTLSTIIPKKYKFHVCLVMSSQLRQAGGYGAKRR